MALRSELERDYKRAHQDLVKQELLKGNQCKKLKLKLIQFLLACVAVNELSEARYCGARYDKKRSNSFRLAISGDRNEKFLGT